jgi:hypothetical protein
MEVGSVKRFAFAIVALVLVAVPLPAQAAGVTYATCVFSGTASFSPGFSVAASSGTYGGKSATVTCAGTFDGKLATGSGTFDFEGKYTDGTCLGHRGAGTYSMTIPTTTGPITLSGTFAENRTAASGFPVGSHPGAVFNGHYDVVPTRGDCVITPITEVTFVMSGTFTTA